MQIFPCATERIGCEQVVATFLISRLRVECKLSIQILRMCTEQMLIMPNIVNVQTEFMLSLPHYRVSVACLSTHNLYRFDVCSYLFMLVQSRLINSVHILLSLKELKSKFYHLCNFLHIWIFFVYFDPFLALLLFYVFYYSCIQIYNFIHIFICSNEIKKIC